MKTIVLYGLQILVGIVALAAGYAKLTGMGFIAEPFAMIGLGHSFLILAGVAEVLAGMCLLFPRSGAVGALLLATVMVGTMGASLGHVISHHGDADHMTVSQTFRTSAQDSMVLPLEVKKNRGWDI